MRRLFIDAYILLSYNPYCLIRGLLVRLRGLDKISISSFSVTDHKITQSDQIDRIVLSSIECVYNCSDFRKEKQTAVRVIQLYDCLDFQFSYCTGQKFNKQNQL